MVIVVYYDDVCCVVLCDVVCGVVGVGCGMLCFDLKGGIGLVLCVVVVVGCFYMVGVFVFVNFGWLLMLMFGGVLFGCIVV